MNVRGWHLAMLATLVAIGALAALAAAQSNPPSSGDWTVTDSTTFSSTTITITNGNVYVSGGSGYLQLTDVDLKFTGTGVHTLTVSGGGRITMSGGSITTTGGMATCQVAINSGGSGNSASKLDGVTISNTNGVSVGTWRAIITNNTIRRSNGNGITVSPMDSYSRQVDISGNTIESPAGIGINILIGNMGGSEIYVNCVGNDINGSGSDGLRLDANTDKGHFFMERNRVTLAGGDGVYIKLQVRAVECKFDDLDVKNSTLDGVHVLISSDINLMRTVDGIHSIGNVGLGVYIEFTKTNWANPVFQNWNISENKGNGVEFINFDCATMIDSVNFNNESQCDYSCVQTDLQIFHTTHRKAMAREDAATKYITSFRYLHFKITWQNGQPCVGNTVVFQDEGDNIIAGRTSDNQGWLPNITGIFDWTVGGSAGHTTSRSTLTPYMTGGTQRLAGPPFEFDRDYEGELQFVDSQTPDLRVDSPAANLVQNFDNLTVRGTCGDPHSGVNRVQVSFDQETNWNRKEWHLADGATSWTYSMSMPDGIYNVYVRAFDNANWPGGLFANITIVNITIDTTAPNLTVRPPPVEPFIITNSTQLTVLGFTDPDVTTVSVNGEFVPVHGGSFNKQMVLIEGDNTIVVVATDFAGNIAKQIRKIRLDSIPPILIVAYPPTTPPYLRTNINRLTMGGYTDLSDVNITIDGKPVNITAGAWSLTLTLVPGPNAIVIDAYDAAQNHRVITVPVYYDNVPPETNVIKPKDGDLLNSSTVIVSGITATDILHDQIQVNGIFIGVSNGLFNYELNVVRDGPLNITIIVEDIAHNVVTKVVHVEIDTTAPQIWNLSLVDGAIVDTPTLTVTGMTEQGATLFIVDSVVQVVDGHFSDQVALKEGRNVVELKVADKANNVRKVDRVVFLDTIPPRYELNGIIGNYTKVKESFATISGNTEPGVRLTLTYNGQTDVAYVNPSGGFEHTIILGTNRTTLIVFRVTDVAGNVYTNELTVEHVKEKPQTVFQRYPSLGYGIVILVVVVVVLIVGTKFAMDASYNRRLKLMGEGEQVSAAYAARTPPARPQGRPLPRAPEQPRAAPPPPPAGRRPPPRPPSSNE